MAKIATVEVRYCADCPHYGLGGNVCLKQSEIKKEFTGVPKRYEIPDWCPLPNKEVKNEDRR